MAVCSLATRLIALGSVLLALSACGGGESGGPRFAAVRTLAGSVASSSGELEQIAAIKQKDL